MKTSIGSLMLTVGLWACLTILCCASRSETTALTKEHRDAIHTILKARGLPDPSSLEVTDSGFLVATYEVNSGADARNLAERAVLAIKDAMLRFKIVDAYRVTVNGPSPGTGVIRRYGSARFTDRLEWEEGI